ASTLKSPSYTKSVSWQHYPHYGSITVFMVLGVMLLLCALVLSIFGIETRKVSLEEISEVN
uniref:hypothetical protein n=1 Tax=Escherichia coli TaxID=562 RepID=UPI00155F5D52